MEIHGFGARLGRWLENFSFSGDPFAVFEADQEGEFLPKCFVDRAYLTNILGDPSRPQTAVLISSPGGGKTATREMVVYECREGRMRGRALPVRYDQFSYVLDLVSGDPLKITLHEHTRAIARLLFQTIKEYVPPTYFDALDDFEREQLFALATEYADPLTRLWLKKVMPCEATSIQWEGFTAAEILDTLINLTCRLGLTKEQSLQSVYILVDRIDELQLVSNQAAIHFLKTLCDGALFNRAKLAFKFFLPQDLAEALYQSMPIAKEKVIIEQIGWDPAALRAVIDQRLNYYSRGNVEHLEELCENTIRSTVMEVLLDRADQSPRKLLRLCKFMVRHHLEREDTYSNSKLDRTDLRYAIEEISRSDQMNQITSVTTHTPQENLTGGTVESDTKGLLIDRDDHVWVDGKLVSPSLSRQEFALLRVLYLRSPHIVPPEELINSVWVSNRLSSESEKSGNFDEQNLRKLIDRLREKLEPENDGKKVRFIRNARGRGYWLSHN